MPYCYQGVRDKRAKLESVLRRLGLSGAQAAAIGDDEPDIPMFEADGPLRLPRRRHAGRAASRDDRAEGRGGHGAVREFIEVILARNGQSGIVTPRPG